MRRLFLGVAAIVSLALLSACGDGGSAKVSGTVTYMQRIAVPEDAVVEVALLDVSLADAEAIEIARTRFKAGGEQPPFAYEITYDPARIKDRHIYSVSARILVDGEIRFISTTHNAAISGTGNSIVDIIVKPIAPVAPGPKSAG